MDEWSLTETLRDDNETWIVRKNLHPLQKHQQGLRYPVCVYLSVQVRPFTEASFPSVEDNDLLEEIEENLLEICEQTDSIFVATVFMPDPKDFIVYSAKPTPLESSLEWVARCYSGFEVEAAAHEDPEWEQYGAFP